MATFRKSKKIGPVRITASKSGLSTSIGGRGVRVTRRADGKITRTLGVPGTGVYDTKQLSGGTRKSRKAPTPRAGAAAVPTSAVPAISNERWVEILSVPGGERATPWQRGYVRGSVGRASGNTRCRRLDFITKPQCEAALAEIGEDSSPLYKGGRDSMGLWWVLVVLLGLTVLVFGVVFPPLLVVALVVGIVVAVQMVRSRRRLRESWPHAYA